MGMWDDKPGRASLVMGRRDRRDKLATGGQVSGVIISRQTDMYQYARIHMLRSSWRGTT